MGKSEEHYGSHDKEKSWTRVFYLHFTCSKFLISRFICRWNCRNLKPYIKKSRLKQSWVAVLKRAKILGAQLLKTEVLQIEQNRFQATICFYITFLLPLRFGWLLLSQREVNL